MALLRIFFLSFLLYILWTFLKLGFNILRVLLQFRVAVKSASVNQGRPTQYNATQGVEEMALDPACGSYVSVDRAISADFKGTRYFFCSPKCLEDYRLKISA